MFDDVLIITLTLTFFCFVIAKHFGVKKPATDLKSYLFKGNSGALSIFSNAGSFLSIALLFTIYFVCVGNYGMFTFLAAFLGIFLAYLFQYWGHKKIILREGDNSKYLNGTMSDIFGDKNIKKTIDIIVYYQYIQSILLEYAVLFYFLKIVFSPWNSLAAIVVFAIAFCCSTYVIIGGFSGVIRTDFFQVLIVLIAIFLIIYNSLPYLAVSLQNIPLIEITPKVRPIEFTIFVMITIGAFTAFPDVWIRNMATYEKKDKRDLNPIIISGLFLFAVLFLISLLSIPLFNDTVISGQKASFSHTFLVEPIMEYFSQFFVKSAGFFSQNKLTFWFTLSAIICVFITTIDTWLIGAFRLKQTVKKKYFIIFLPYSISFSLAFISFYLNGKVITIIGIIFFPFLFFNTLVFISAVFKKIQKKVTSKMLLISLSLAILSSCLLIVWYNMKGSLWIRVPDILFYSAIILYSSFFYQIYRKKGV